MALSLESAPAPNPDCILFEWGGRYGLILGTCGADWLMASAFDGVFLIDVPNRRLRCHVADPAGAAWQDVLVRRVLPRVAMLFGAVIIHGAAVARAGRGLVLLGPSGAGKSTLSAALGHGGWDILSDDIAILQHPGSPVIAPATTGVCVWGDSRAALDLPLGQCAPMPGYEGKLRYVSGHDVGTEPVPLTGLVVLERSADRQSVAIEPIAPGEALIRTAHQRIRFNPMDGHDGETQRTFAQLGAIVHARPSWRLAYPARYDALPAVRDALLTLIAP